MKFFNPSEIKTNLYVFLCKKLIGFEVEEFFRQIDSTCYGLLPEIIKNRRVNTVIFNKYDLEKIYQISEIIMLKTLLKRYKNIPIPVKQLKRNRNIHLSLLNLTHYQIEQKKSLHTFQSLIISLTGTKNKPKGFKNFDEKLINREYERIRKALKSIKQGIIQEINREVTDIFLATHNKLQKSIKKKNLSKKTEDETRKNQALEA